MLILSDEEMSALKNEADKELARRFYRDYVEYVLSQRTTITG
ncbi:hypothetical protein [Lysinibacillus sp. NPDC047702]